MTSIAPERLADVFVEVADTLVTDFDLIEFLQTVTTRAAELVDASAAGLLLGDHRGQLHFMAASDERTKLLELFQVQSREGPCLDAFRDGAPVVNSELDNGSQRWPQFAPRAVAAGFRAVHAFPLRLRGETIGALNLFGTEGGRMEPADVHVIQALADVATIGILQERAVRRAEVVAEQLQGALNSRVAIEQAKGALAQIHGIDVDTAFERLRSYARNHHLRLSELAHTIIDDPDSAPELTTA